MKNSSSRISWFRMDESLEFNWDKISFAGFKVSLRHLFRWWGNQLSCRSQKQRLLRNIRLERTSKDVFLDYHALQQIDWRPSTLSKRGLNESRRLWSSTNELVQRRCSRSCTSWRLGLLCLRTQLRSLSGTLLQKRPCGYTWCWCKSMLWKAW